MTIIYKYQTRDDDDVITCFHIKGKQRSGLWEKFQTRNWVEIRLTEVEEGAVMDVILAYSINI